MKSILLYVLLIQFTIIANSLIAFRDGDKSICKIIDTDGHSVYMERNGIRGHIDKELIEYIVLYSDTIWYNNYEKLYNKKANVTKSSPIEETSENYSRTVYIPDPDLQSKESILSQKNIFSDIVTYRVKFTLQEAYINIDSCNLKADSLGNELIEYIEERSDIIGSNYTVLKKNNPTIAKEVIECITLKKNGVVECGPRRGTIDSSPIGRNLTEISSEYLKNKKVDDEYFIKLKIKFIKTLKRPSTPIDSGFVTDNNDFPYPYNVPHFHEPIIPKPDIPNFK